MRKSLEKAICALSLKKKSGYLYSLVLLCLGTLSCTETLERWVGVRSQSGNLGAPSPSPAPADPVVPPSCDSTRVGQFGGGLGTSLDPFRICSVAQWTHWTESPSEWDKVIQLEDDLDFSALTSIDPVGNSTTRFTGELRGNQKKISGLNLASIPLGFGLFGQSEGNVRISELTLEDFEFTSGVGTFGVLIGQHFSGSLEFSQVTVKNLRVGMNTNLNSTGFGLVASASSLTASEVEFDGFIFTCPPGGRDLRSFGSLVGVVGSDVSATLEVSSVTVRGFHLDCGDGTSGGGIGVLVGTAVTGSVEVDSVSIQNFILDHWHSNPAGIGGLIGGIGNFLVRPTSVSISNVEVSGSFPKRSNYGGMIVGDVTLEGPMEVDRVRAISSSERQGGRSVIGGLIGDIFAFENGEDIEIVIRNSFSQSDLYVLDAPAGGLIGAINTDGTVEIIDSYATGNIRSNDTFIGSADLAGLVAVIQSGTLRFVRSYYSGAITYTGDIPMSRGCLLGRLVLGATVSAEDATWNSDECLSNATQSGALIGAVGRASADFQAATPFPNWLSPPWIFTAGQNPQLSFTP